MTKHKIIKKNMVAFWNSKKQWNVQKNVFTGYCRVTECRLSCIKVKYDYTKRKYVNTINVWWFCVHISMWENKKKTFKNFLNIKSVFTTMIGSCARTSVILQLVVAIISHLMAGVSSQCLSSVARPINQSSLITTRNANSSSSNGDNIRTCTFTNSHWYLEEKRKHLDILIWGRERGHGYGLSLIHISEPTRPY